MKQDENYMNQTFGESEITRQIFADMPYPICVKNLSDTQMKVLAQLVEGTLKDKYPDKAEKMFTLWRNGVDDDADIEFLKNECVDVEAEWWELLEWYATNCFGAKYYNDDIQNNDIQNNDIKKESKNMKQDKAYMTKTFGRSNTTRQDFEDMPHPICTKNITDEQMEKLVKEVEDEVIYKYPDVTEKMFTLWKEGTNTDEEIEFLMNECSDAEDYWWNLLQFNAINNYGAKYYEDMKMESHIEIENTDPTKEQIDVAIEDIDKKSAEYKEAAEMMEETKRRAEVVEMAEKLWINCYANQYDGYSYSIAFKDAEAFVTLKNKYLKEGKII
jgi:hypothetical protein